MPDYRRYMVPGATYFFTVVTDGRAAILCSDRSRSILHAAFEKCRDQLPFEMPAVVLLPDHLHAMWTLPDGDCDYSKRWGVIKKAFTELYLAEGGTERSITAGRRRQRRRGVWQPRFWEHMIRDENDFVRHLDYIHYNPVKHGHAARPRDWKWSSFHRWVRAGMCPINWGCGPDDMRLNFEDIAGTVGE